MNGYNFTERVRKTLAMAREEAARLRHHYVGTEHILLALLREGQGVASTVLQNLEVDVERLRNSIDEVVERGTSDSNGQDLSYTSRAKKTLELAMSEARSLHHQYVGTEHLLLGLIAERKGIAAQALNEHGVTLDKARAETLKILGADGAPADEQGQPEVLRRRRLIASMPQRFSERLLEVLGDARDVATERYSAEVMPIHVAIALLQHGEGMANAVLDRLGADRAGLLRALEAEAKNAAEDARAEHPAQIGDAVMQLRQWIENEGRW